MKSFSSFILTFLISLISFHNSFSQNQSKIDSLRTQLKVVNNDTDQVKLLNILCKKYWNLNYDSAFYYGYKAIELAENIEDKVEEALGFNNIGNVFYFQGDYASALKNYLTSLKIRKEIGDQKLIAASYNNIGIIYSISGDLSQALSNHFLSLKIKEDIGDQKGIAASCTNIGNIYMDQDNYDDALENFFRALKIDKETGDKVVIADSYDNIGIVYRNQGELALAAGDKNASDSKYKKALESYEIALRLRKEKDYKRGMGFSYTNIGNILLHQGDYDKALENYTASLEISNKFNDKRGIGISYLNIGGLYAEIHNYKKATIFLHKSLSLTKAIGEKDRILKAYHALSDVYSKMYQYQEAYEYHQLYTAIKDSIFNEASAKSMNEMQTKYESEKKEKEIEMLTKDNDLQALETKQQEDQIKKQWYLIVGIVFVLGLLISLIYVVNSRLKFKKEANMELEHINVELGKKNKSIAESINYAQRIQETIMPTQKHLQEIFPESFIFYKAKDVVSGDFPWVMKNDKNFFAATVDCTGHGVPGAMMSMIGYFLLNDIVGGKNIHDPSEILAELHEGIKHTLRQEENIESKDGMDIALCSINKEKREVQYAGAHRSLLWFHDGIIEEIRGNRFPVGGLQYSSRGKEIKFTNHKLQLAEGDSIFFYSDGLIDQVGGPKGRRFQNDQVKEIITDNKDKSMDELKVIFNDQFIKWMGSEKQLDDVIMMGIKV
ncbi:MAG: hypothetical protein COC01_07875 [Bacteroidetes bacterium]|nr:MAG: hypothetical protein COC01_07875 [Bacteroidota bacterium]